MYEQSVALRLQQFRDGVTDVREKITWFFDRVVCKIKGLIGTK